MELKEMTAPSLFVISFPLSMNLLLSTPADVWKFHYDLVKMFIFLEFALNF